MRNEHISAICCHLLNFNCEKADPQRNIHLHQTDRVGLKGSKGFSWKSQVSTPLAFLVAFSKLSILI